MRELKIVDMTLRECERIPGMGLSFKEKLEAAKLLERMHVDAIETGYVSDSQADVVSVRAIAATIQNSVVCCPFGLDEAALTRTWQALSQAKHPRLDLIAPVSTVQMEYGYHLKAEQVLARSEALLARSRALCPDVEFTAEDAVRGERNFLVAILRAALRQGVKTVTLVDAAGQLLPWETSDFINSLCETVPELERTMLSLHCKSGLGMAAANALAAVSAGVGQLKATFNGLGAAQGNLSLAQLAHALLLRSDVIPVSFQLNTTEMQRIVKQLESLIGMNRSGRSAFGHTLAKPKVKNDGAALTSGADLLLVRRRIQDLGYDLNEKDIEAVYKQFQRIAAKKKVDDRDIDALVAENAQQVAPAYQLVDYVINSGNAITATAVLRVNKEGNSEQSVSLGDGPIDAAFLAIEQILGHHFELEDFHIQAVTEGREAMGDALVKLRYNGSLYSGRGLSTDIIGASIRAYLNAVNKIVYEEKSR